ncbi:zinc finger CCCH domain-containing protein 14-like [Pistacia vera]|uniref:zinc finger CCCH domain-containing protein 14 n=1 Tax=Pistacia vera TaxID=55513 RepID=UPI001263C3E4|nr:zinc finger CCCH domain-containing protein 14 [Pistacia vera]XP_031253294.1 zinc finger CCCH domain-containing protein 14-like [Pistacia vera]
MDKEREHASPLSDFKTSTMTSTTETPNSSPPSDFGADFSSIFHSIFPPRSSTDDHYHHYHFATEHRLNQARLVLEYQQLCDHYDLCFSRLQSLNRELETLVKENADLRLANAGLLKLITNSFHRLTEDISSGFSPKSVMEKRNVVERDTLPKSISVRSSGYLKSNQTNQSSGPSRQGAQRAHVPSGNNEREEEAAKAKAEGLEVYNQGMWKTELCNKWQETGTCPYGDYCQFAHGINELRPVIRHPKYKTEVCRMVLSGATCPYGHRCHFRHSLTEQERSLMLPR